ncbi:MAG TPA: hypothetical protein VFD69_02350 [Vicinamibacterales bacterium]|nr:hypothetical protein [Vicinamibacterales bacterium]
MRLSSILSAAAAVGVLASAAPALAQDPPNPLTKVKALRCRFPVAVSGTWKNGEVAATPRTQELLINVTEIDIGDGTAEVAGTAGKAFVSAVLSGWSLYFVDNGVGQLNVTTVFAQENSPGKLKAVHSRHGYLQMQVGKFISEPSVSQNYGECEILP